MKVNNITRLLETHNVSFTAFELPAEKLSAEETASYLNVPLAQVYKTIVVTRQGRGKPLLALVAGDTEVDLKMLAKAVGEKKLSLPTQKEAERLTGLQAGGISPLALLNKGFEVVIDERATQFEEIYISAGQRGLNIRLPLLAFVNFTKASLQPISMLIVE